MFRNKPSLIKKKLLRDGKNYDESLLWVIVLMTAFSLVMVFSASVSFAQAGDGSKWFYLQRQALFVLAGAFFAFLAFALAFSFAFFS